MRASAQIKIAGSVYGGGNEGNVGGNTTVTLRAGDLNKVFGGARMADIDGRSFVNIDGEHASDYMLINYVYAGNDISGTVGKKNETAIPVATLPDELTKTAENHIDATWDAYVRISNTTKKRTVKDEDNAEVTKNLEIYIGQLFGSGNGDYDYQNVSGVHTIYKKGTNEVIATTTEDFSLPELKKTYLEILGGSIVYAFGGGNNATVTKKTVIHVENPSDVVNSIRVKTKDSPETWEELLSDARIAQMGYNPGYTYPTSAEFQIGSFFGGNNRATMAIRPTWNLKSGKIRNIYSGGNEGDMTSLDGLLLEIPEGSTMIVDNIYGGCRKADVCPGGNKSSPERVDKLEGYYFPAGMPARVLISGGDVNNVYGGNDISGKVYGGNAVGVYASVRGDVYGGGNGSYPYTDNAALKDDPTYGDLYYGDPDQPFTSGEQSVDALNAFRPNAEQVSICVHGTENKKTIIGGSIYIGGNSATLATSRIANPKVELKIGSYVIAENVFLGNNGANMVDYHAKDADHYHEGVLRTYKTSGFTNMDLTDSEIFSKYMEGCAMSLHPSVVFENVNNGDRFTYIDYTSYFGSFYCGGNVGSMIASGTNTINFNHKVIIYNKLVGGCNDAHVSKVEGYRAEYIGGIIGSTGERDSYTDNDKIKDRLILNLSNLKIRPMRMPIAGLDDNASVTGTPLVWNTIKVGERDANGNMVPVAWNDNIWKNNNALSSTMNRRFDGGNIYGGCCTSGVVNGNVVININATIVDRDVVFDEVETDDQTGEDKLYGNDYTIKAQRTGVILGQQGMDVLGSALNVFGGGKGEDTEIWGSATVNLNRGYTFQIFGGSEQGAIGKKNSAGQYVYDPKYSTYVNLAGPDSKPGVPKSEDMSDDMAEAEFFYGGGFEGPIAGDTHIDLANGRIFNTFAGSCNADIQGHTETYIGVNGFPYVRDYVYGGNDLGGKILGEGNFADRLRNNDVSAKVYNTDVLNASAYIEYVQGRVEKIFGGCYGVYDYTDPLYGKYFYAEGGTGTTDDNKGQARIGYSKPYLDNAFVNFRPTESNNVRNTVAQIYGAGQGYFGEKEENKMQDRSYILIDIPQSMKNYQSTAVFGAGECGGVGMHVGLSGADADVPTDDLSPDKASAIIDLVSGEIKTAYGGSYMEGVTRRTVVNVPEGSTIKLNKIFGGAYGTDTYHPCDVYEANVNYRSELATLTGAIYGGNNNERRTLYGKVNISKPVYTGESNESTGELYLGTVYGAGLGANTWSEYTEVNLETGAKVYEVYGGGEAGKVHNAESVQKFINAYKPTTWPDDSEDENQRGKEFTTADWKYAWTLGGGYDPASFDFSSPITTYVTNIATNLNNPLVRKAKMDDRETKTYRYNTNVIISEGAEVSGYAYGGGLGEPAVIAGTTYIALLGGKVEKDLYAAGTSGSVEDMHKAGGFIASANAYIEGGTARNVYGGGWKGSVGHHTGTIDVIATSADPDIPGETHVVIGKLDGTTFINGIPAIERNAYGGGEGGAVFGTANITLHNGFIGYRHFDSTPTTDTDLRTIQVGSDYYQEKLHDETWRGDGTNRLYDSGCIFGGGYIDNSSVDVTNVKMMGGHVRNSLFGGGEIAAIGRGIITATGESNSVRSLQGIYKAGKTKVELLEGYVHRNVFGGGRGYNNLGESGKLYSDGYVFGQTEVDIFGGEVGTVEELALGQGNVFGGGDIGYVYSAYENESGILCYGKKSGTRYDDSDEGYYYKYENGSFKIEGNEKIPTEDCKVLVEPHCRVNEAVTINNQSYAVGDYVTTTDLNTLKNKDDDAERWGKLDQKGIIIHNAVFAGGNTSSGSAAVYANATSVFGNATASIHDVYHRDLITLGTGHTGGLYGDGNLTFVDGYRGLNITNYGTDYYTISPEITIDQYHELPAREAAYYELRYKCIQNCTDKEGTNYYAQSNEHPKASTLSADDILTLFDTVTGMIVTNSAGEKVPNSEYWKENGVCSIYAGRLMNTIQRADFCGVFGSRMVMQGAQDRVPEIVDYTNYTINRVREVSLNKQHSVIADDLAVKTGATQAADPNDQDPDDYVNQKKAIHGNYFGIYNIVNFLGALSSDVRFDDTRKTDNVSNPAYTVDGKTFYQWKGEHINEQKRNNGTSLNKVALASGVYLELTTEKSTGSELNEKDWGYITGVIELDLINVQTGVGGGFVYAKNEHRGWTYNKKNHATLTALNAEAVTRKDYDYTSTYVEWETSGNFVHSTQTIIDDCYNISGKYQGTDAVPAHYWYIKGQVYVYDQEISAYTGAPNAYSETVDIPLTITAASHGTMKLLDVKPNLYAYYSAPNTKLKSEQKIVINEKEYYLNDPICYWDYQLLTSAEKILFEEQTYVCITDCKIGSKIYRAGEVYLPTEYLSMETSATTETIDGKSVKAVYQIVDEENNVTKLVPFTYAFRSSNNLGHETGYILTYKVNNPVEWNTWYTKVESTTHEKQQTEADGYEDGPTYYLSSGADRLLGQREYKVGNLISKDVEDTYQAIKTNHSSAIPGGQAEFEAAYIVTSDVTVIDENNQTNHVNPGSAVSATDAAKAAFVGHVSPAYICTSTIQFSKTEFIYLNTKMTEAEKAQYITDHPDFEDEINKYVVPAYYCTTEGLYGGNYYEAGKNYRGLETWCSMSETDSNSFTFNYDALDLLINSDYSGSEGQKYKYDGKDYTTAEQAQTNRAGYSLEQPLDYTATYHGTETETYNGVTLQENKEYSRTDYEKLPNEQRHYAAVNIKEAGKYYVVNTPLLVGSTPYAVGATVTQDIYNHYGDHVTELDVPSSYANSTIYFCRESYQVGHNGSGVAVTAVSDITNGGSGTYSTGATVPVGLVINRSSYGDLVNKQTNFSIHGISPTETSTLFVSRTSDIFDLSTEKIITVIYQYDYEESDVSGNVTPISERHVVNIHIKFKSGVPSVEDIRAPQIVIPGDKLGLREPNVTPGAYEVTGGGWELFEKKGDAESHINGVEYVPNSDQLYWYQDGYYVAYYAKTYLGKTYSNHVPVSVANYHDLKKVMDDSEHHYYIDRPVKRDCKVYINDYSSSSQNGLDLLKDLVDLTYGKGTQTYGAFESPENITGAENLDIIMRTNIDHPAAWMPIASGTGECFGGTLHGDGYYVDGLNNSLFGQLCGNVYNLGVMGSFASAGVADTGGGYVENCWIKTTASSVNNVNAVFGNPTAESGYKIVNCYYPKTLAYNTTDNGRGLANPVDVEAFHNGTVAYNLNGFYLYKRYNDKKTTSGTEYKYYTINADKTLSAPTTKHYAQNYNNCSAGASDVYELGGYVEDRFAYGDFRFADGQIPTSDNERMYVDTDDKVHYYPIWPDDYLYFGQMLTYGWNELRPHEEVPSHLYKNGDRLVTTDRSNRVYRAPAYYGNATKSVAHFNPHFNLVSHSKPKNAADTDLHPAYPGMTAIDFKGHNESEYWIGFNNDDLFYPPLLDDAGLQSIVNRDETANLLVYAPAADVNQQTYNVLTQYFQEPKFSDYYDGGDTYRRVAIAPTQAIFGHLVQSTLKTASDHLLVDKEDFNCPIAYQMGDGFRMWYQRTPDNFVTITDDNKTTGWEGICLPFEAELVSTEDKGEITHFYGNSKTGHEYWLREYMGGSPSSDNKTFVADFQAISAGSHSKDYTNTYLWDFYYSHDDGTNSTVDKDKNEENYQQDYYKTAHSYSSYPYNGVGVPYLVGFPGKSYYEFDLSGEWAPLNRYNNVTITNPGSQVISFVSESGGHIGKSDKELDDGQLAATINGYAYVPNYINTTLSDAGTGYVLASDGGSYVKNAEGATVSAFRPYIVYVGGGTRGVESNDIEQVIFRNEYPANLLPNGDPSNGLKDGALTIYARKGKIVVESSLRYTENIGIYTPAGITLNTFRVKAGETMETPVYSDGVYIVRSDDGQYSKKVIVKRNR
jgi:hypothetical protein